MHYKYDLSLILPCFNEQEIFTDSLEQIIKVLNKTDWTWEIILVDDKSTDKTASLIKKALKKYSRYNISAIFHQKNLGRGKTVADGFMSSHGKILGFIDIDLETPAWYIPQFVESLNKDFDLAIAKRIYDLNPSNLLRWIFSKAYAHLVSKILNLPIVDTEAGYKFFKKSKIMPILKKCQDPHWFWDTEIVVFSLKAKLRLKSIPVVFIRRTDKTSTVRLFPDTLDYIYKLIKNYSKLKLK